MKSKKWFLLLLIRIISISAEECASDDDVIVHLEGVPSNNMDELTIRADYKIREWVYLFHGNRLETDGFFEITWTNKSLDFTHLSPCNKLIKIRNDGFQNFWKPHVYFTYSSEIVDNNKEYKVKIHEDGSITLIQRIKQVFPCHTDSGNHPFSNTTCTLEWKYMNVADYQKVTIDKSNTTDSRAPRHHGSLILNDVNFALSDDDNPQLVYSFTQNPQDILINFFLPSLLFLIPAWLTLLLGPMAITRCCILMTSLILLSIHYHSSIPLLLESGGVTAISIWKLFTYFFVVSIVVELIIITLLASMGRSKTCCFAKRRSAKYEMEPLYEEMNDLRQRKTRKTRNCCRKAALFFDIASFLFFGVILVLFCYGYYVERHAVVRLINDFEMESLYIL